MTEAQRVAEAAARAANAGAVAAAVASIDASAAAAAEQQAREAAAARVASAPSDFPCWSGYTAVGSAINTPNRLGSHRFLTQQVINDFERIGGGQYTVLDGSYSCIKQGPISRSLYYGVP